MKMGVSGGWGVRTGSHDPGREGVWMVWGGCSDMDVGVSILYPSPAPLPESVFTEGRGYIYMAIGRVLLPCKPPPPPTCESHVYGGYRER